MSGSRLILLGSILLLAGCDTGPDFSDLQVYMAEVRARPVAPIEPIPVFQPYEAFTYSAAALRSPFQPPSKIEVQRRVKGAPEIKPDENRPRQFLEGFNIEDFVMVGTLSRGNTLYALVNGAGGVYKVQKGDYLGRNHGHIIAIADDRIEVVEIVPDGEGGWLERPRAISLREGSGEQKPR